MDAKVNTLPLAAVKALVVSGTLMPQVPWVPHTVAPEFQMRKCVGVAPAPPEAVPVQLPSSVLVVPEAAFIQSAGSVSVARSVPESAAAQLAGMAPEKMRKSGDAPVTDSTRSRRGR